MRMLISLSIALFATAALAQDAAKAKATIEAEKCTKCHAVSIKGIELKAEKEDSKAPDLAKLLGSIKEKDAAGFIVKFLNKEAKLNDKNHKMKFKGAAADLEALAKFLVANQSK